MNAEQAQKFYYETYRQIMSDHIGEYSKPIVQKEIRDGSWEAVIRKIEAEATKNLSADKAHLERLLKAEQEAHANTKAAYDELFAGVMANISADTKPGPIHAD